MPKGHPRNPTCLNDLSIHLKPRTGTHGWYLDYGGEMVDGPFRSKRDAEEALIYYRECWHCYYREKSLLTVRKERRSDGHAT
jgi:hypothetical protein